MTISEPRGPSLPISIHPPSHHPFHFLIPHLSQQQSRLCAILFELQRLLDLRLQLNGLHGGRGEEELKRMR